MGHVLFKYERRQVHSLPEYDFDVLNGSQVEFLLNLALNLLSLALQVRHLDFLEVFRARPHC